MSFTLLFDDDTPLAPLTDLRPVYRVRTGVTTTIERWQSTLSRPIDGVWVPERLAELESELSDGPVRPDLTDLDDVLLLNGACVLPPAVHALGMGEWIASDQGTLLAARCSGSQAITFLDAGTPPTPTAYSIADDHPIITRVCDVIRLRDPAISLDLHHVAASSAGAIPDGVHLVGDKPVVVSEGALVGLGTVIDATGGSVYIARGATVRPRCTLIGPCAVLEGATVQDGAVIRANTVIGPVCKVGGEVGGTIFQGFSNKGHDGYLGDAFVGEWVNLGAGTNNSNLLNTYGHIKAAPHLGAERESTGLTFFGGVIGDHAKTAIGTRLATGTLIGTGAMCASASSPPSTTERFLWLTDNEPSRYRWARFEEVARAVMARRGVAPSDAYLDTLRALHDGDAS